MLVLAIFGHRTSNIDECKVIYWSADVSSPDKQASLHKHNTTV